MDQDRRDVPAWVAAVCDGVKKGTKGVHATHDAYDTMFNILCCIESDMDLAPDSVSVRENSAIKMIWTRQAKHSRRTAWITVSSGGNTIVVTLLGGSSTVARIYDVAEGDIVGAVRNAMAWISMIPPWSERDAAKMASEAILEIVGPGSRF
jgi:hypothetical protein